MVNETAFPADLLQIRAPALNFYILRDAAGLYLLDAGFIGGVSFYDGHCDGGDGRVSRFVALL